VTFIRSDAVVTDKVGSTIIVIFIDQIMSTLTLEQSTRRTSVEPPEWPANDASFDYRMPGTAGAGS
jgi:hypothetical protein